MAKKKETKPLGRTPKIDKDALAKLEMAFKIGLNDENACKYAHIDPSTMYRYQNKNPDFCKQKEAWKKNPDFKARYTMYQNLNDPNWASWWLEHRDDDFSNKSKLELETKGINIVVADDEHKQMLEDL